MNANNYQIVIVTWSHTIVYKLLVLDRNIIDHVTVQIITIREEHLTYILKF